MDQISFIPIGGIGDVTKNMYLYELGNEILIVDCGMGFADQNMPGVDLLIPDISYLKTALSQGKKIVGMVLSHGHEDHIGGLPFILPSLPQFPIYGSSLTAALSNEKLADFGIRSNSVKVLNFGENLRLGRFEVSLIRMTHSIIDAGNISIKTPAGNFYHGSDFKFDFTPVDGKPSELGRIARAGDEGVMCLLSDCLGASRSGYTPSEKDISTHFEEEFRRAKGKIFVTTYSSNISRLNQAIEVALSMNRKVCFIGRSLLKSRDIGRALAYMNLPKNAEIKPSEVKRFKPNQVMILVAGSQAQEESALVRIANNQDRDLTINKGDTVIFSSDPIPGNETSIYALVDTLSRRGARVIYSDITEDFHVSGHGSQEDLKLLISLTRPHYLLPIGGTYRHMIAYRELAVSMGYKEDQVLIPENGQEVIFSKNAVRLGKKFPNANIYVDQYSGETVENFVLIDRMKIAKEGLLIVIVEVDTQSGKILSSPDILTKGFVLDRKDQFVKQVSTELSKRVSTRNEKVNDWTFYKKTIQNIAEKILYREGREPLIVPVVLEV